MIASGGRVTVSTKLWGAPAVKRQLAENVLNASKNMLMFRLDYGLDNLVSNYTILNRQVQQPSCVGSDQQQLEQRSLELKLLRDQRVVTCVILLASLAFVGKFICSGKSMA